MPKIPIHSPAPGPSFSGTACGVMGCAAIGSAATGWLAIGGGGGGGVHTCASAIGGGGGGGGAGVNANVCATGGGAACPTGWPHFTQKRVPSAMVAPHAGQKRGDKFSPPLNTLSFSPFFNIISIF